jgi:hypothetical protein
LPGTGNRAAGRGVTGVAGVTVSGVTFGGTFVAGVLFEGFSRGEAGVGFAPVGGRVSAFFGGVQSSSKMFFGPAATQAVEHPRTTINSPKPGFTCASRC